MKKTVIASLAVLASAAVVATFALGGAGKFGNVRVNADEPESTEYSITFDASDTANTTVENPYGHGNYAICRTTARGNKLGVVGRSYYNESLDRLYFGEAANFGTLRLTESSSVLMNAGANDIKHITGFQVTFTGNLKLRYEVENEEEEMFEEVEQDLESEVKYDVSLTPSNSPMFARDEYSDDVVTVYSLTIWYSC